MELLDKYFKLQSDLYDYFGYKEDWVVIPVDDNTKAYWGIVGEEDDGQVWFCFEEKTLISLNPEDIYSNEIYTQRFLPKWVYRGKDYTMIVVDTRVDGNKFLQIYDNKKERDTSNLQNY